VAEVLCVVTERVCRDRPTVSWPRCSMCAVATCRGKCGQLNMQKLSRQWRARVSCVPQRSNAQMLLGHATRQESSCPAHAHRARASCLPPAHRTRCDALSGGRRLASVEPRRAATRAGTFSSGLPHSTPSLRPDSSAHLALSIEKKAPLVVAR
jgi:hypothetical protein